MLTPHAPLTYICKENQVINRKAPLEGESFLAAIREELRRDAQARYLHRVALVSLMVGGLNVNTLSEVSGISRNTLSAWLTRAMEEGLEGLRPKKQQGRPSRLSPEQLNSLKEVLDNDPLLYGFSAWDGPSLAAFIEKRFGVGFSVRQCQRLFRRLTQGRVRAVRTVCKA